VTQTHDHPHHPPAGEHPPAGGPVLLDIGDGVGAAVVECAAAEVGRELYALPARHDLPPTHTGVWERPVGHGACVVAVFPALPAGRYRLSGAGWTGRLLEVRSGEVTHLTLAVGGQSSVPLACSSATTPS
jgi:hypothetical protein